MLGRGYMVADSGLTIHGQNANDVVSAEIVSMVKERVQETYGPIAYTIGQGCSGGAIQQYVIAASYPGLLDGLLPACSFPDIWTTATEVTDCGLLSRYFLQTSPALWAVPAQRSAVEGHYSDSSCQAWNLTFGPRFANDDPANCGLPAEQVYDAQTRPDGVRCGLNDYQAAIWGPRPKAVWGAVEKRLGRGFPDRPLDNVGVEYGLRALESGAITTAQFLDLNEKVGGLDVDGAPQPARTSATTSALRTAYASGHVTSGRELANVPIIELRGNDNEEIHTSVYSHVLRARLQRDNGTTANHALWTSNITLLGDPAWSCGPLNVGGLADVPAYSSCDPRTSALLAMDEWLATIKKDKRHVPQARKVLDARPARATDSCWVAGRQITDPSLCATTSPSFTTPRLAAGAPLTNDVLKCRLTPVDTADHGVVFTPAERARLKQIFPTGVCDYRQPGVEQQKPEGTWHDYGTGPGGTARRAPSPRLETVR